MLSEKETKVLTTFKAIIPNLTEKQIDQLIWFGEGMAFKTNEQESKKDRRRKKETIKT